MAAQISPPITMSRASSRASLLPLFIALICGSMMSLCVSGSNAWSNVRISSMSWASMFINLLRVDAGGGAGKTAMRNQHGVVIHLYSATQGVNLKVAVDAVKAALKQRERQRGSQPEVRLTEALVAEQ